IRACSHVIVGSSCPVILGNRGTTGETDCMDRDCLPLPTLTSRRITPPHDARVLNGATWNWALVLLTGVFVARVLYLRWWSPWELVGDEAYYWEQARHLDLCYDEKGPALAWLIAACCHFFGNTEWAVRLPVALCSLVAGWGVGRLAM